MIEDWMLQNHSGCTVSLYWSNILLATSNALDALSVPRFPASVADRMAPSAAIIVLSGRQRRNQGRAEKPTL
jgi:hypothetical protein